MPKQKKQIFLKFKQQVMRALNIKEKNIQKQIKIVFDFYKNSLKDIIYSNIDNGVFKRNNLLQLLKPSIAAFQLARAILLLF